jgi:dephospho-CoA kinase
MKIAMCGPMASGKSFIAERLIADAGYQRVSLARGVKLLGRAVIEALIADGLVAPEQAGIKQRRLLQAIGAEGRAIDANMWIRDAVSESRKHDLVIIDDVRFINEARALVNEGFLLIRLRFADDESQMARLQKAYPDDWERHWESRNDVSECEYTQIPEELISLDLTVTDGEDNWREVAALVDLTTYTEIITD